MNDITTTAKTGCRQDTLIGIARVGGAYRVVVTEAVATGEALLHIDGDLLDRPTRHSIQIDDRYHIDADPTAALQPEQLFDHFPWRFLNHACVPNAVVRGREVVAARPIRAWEEVTFNYNTTEYEISCPFPCRCGRRDCRGRLVRGFKHLSRDEREQLLPALADHLARRLARHLEEDPGAGPPAE